MPPPPVESLSMVDLTLLNRLFAVARERHHGRLLHLPMGLEDIADRFGMTTEEVVACFGSTGADCRNWTWSGWHCIA